MNEIGGKALVALTGILVQCHGDSGSTIWLSCNQCEFRLQPVKFVKEGLDMVYFLPMKI